MKWEEGAKFEDPKPGSYLARCYSLIDLGTQQHSFNGETWAARDVRLSFELPTTKMTGEYNSECKGKPFAVHWNGTQSLHPNAKLRKLLEGWRGQAFDKDSIAAFVPKKMVGATCRVVLVKNEKGYINVTAVSPVSPEEKKKFPKPINDSVYFSLDPNEFSREVFDGLHEKTQEKIKKSPEFKALMGGGPGEEPQHDAPEEGGSGEPGTVADDDVPF